MLEKNLSSAIEHFRIKPGEEVGRIEISSLSVGQVIRAHTVSGNQYLFEVTDPKAFMAHVVRCCYRPYAPRTGYRGERRVSPVFKIGWIINHDSSYTSEVERLILIK